MMLQSIRYFEGSVKFFERAKDTQQAVFGEDHLVTAES